MTESNNFSAFIEGPKLSDKEYKLFVDFIYDRSGIDLGDNKKELLKARLAKRLKHFGLKTYKEYYEHLMGDVRGDELVEMINAVSTNVTSFFREKQHFDFMRKTALPEILAAKKKIGERSVRIWSCASSTGEEVYTATIVVSEHIGAQTGWHVKFLGTDISTKVLEIASRGIYHAEKIAQVPVDLQAKYFTKEEGNYYKIKDQARKMVTFARLNLMDKTFPFKNKFDIIFCRNVMIYFDKETQRELVMRLHRYLEPGGYLFIGHSESLIGLKVDFKYIAPAIFQKV